MRDALFQSAWGPIALGLVVGCMTLVAALVVLSRPRSAWVRNRLEPYAAAGAGGSIDDAADEPWRPPFEQMHGAVTRAFSRTRAWRALERRLEKAHVQMSPAELVLWTTLLGLGCAIVVLVLGGSTFLALLALLAGLAAPSFWLSRRAHKRLTAFEEQLPDVLMTMAGSLKVGQSFNNSMRAIVDEGLSPASEEFGRVLAEARVGRPMDEALAAMADRIGSEDLRFVLMSVNIQREVGGSLSDYFGTVSETVRQRQQFRRRVRALTAMGRTSAALLLALPFITGALIAIIGDGYLAPLFTTAIGRTMVVVMLILMTCGALIIRKIVDIKG